MNQPTTWWIENSSYFQYIAIYQCIFVVDSLFLGLLMVQKSGESPGMYLTKTHYDYMGYFYHFQMSNDKNLGWLGYIGDYTTQLYRAI